MRQPRTCLSTYPLTWPARSCSRSPTMVSALIQKTLLPDIWACAPCRIGSTKLEGICGSSAARARGQSCAPPCPPRIAPYGSEEDLPRVTALDFRPESSYGGKNMSMDGASDEAAENGP